MKIIDQVDYFNLFVFGNYLIISQIIKLYLSTMNKFKSVIPLLNRVLIKKIVPEAKSAGGIILSDKSLEKEARIGVVISTGPGFTSDTGKLIPMIVKIGDHVLLPEYQGIGVPLKEKEEFVIYKDTEFLAILEDVKKV